MREGQPNYFSPVATTIQVRNYGGWGVSIVGAGRGLSSVEAMELRGMERFQKHFEGRGQDSLTGTLRCEREASRMTLGFFASITGRRELPLAELGRRWVKQASGVRTGVWLVAGMSRS